jgi:hypothetical protein
MPGDMNEFLAAAYATAQPAPVHTDAAEKVAHAELFAKLAAESGLDLTQLTDEQIAAAWNEFRTQVTTKTAEAGQPAGQTKAAGEHGHAHKHEHKEAAAKREFEQTKQAQVEWEQKNAEADFLGRRMAHAYVDELKKIASATGSLPGQTAPAAAPGESKEAAMPPFLQKLKGHAAAAAGKAKDKGKDAVETAKKHKGHAAAAAGGAAAGAAGGFMAGKSKKASALDELAALKAVEKVAEAGLDANEAAEKIAAIFGKGEVKDSEKIAGVEDFNTALEVRSLELLEQVGYKVEWKQA